MILPHPTRRNGWAPGLTCDIRLDEPFSFLLAHYLSEKQMTRITAVVAIVALLQTAVFHAQAPIPTPDGWARAVTAPPGTRVRLTLLNGTIVRGLLAEARADSLVLTDNELERGQLTSPSGSLRDPHTFIRAEIGKVQAEGIGKPRSRGQRVLMGLAAVGAIIGGLLVAVLVWCAPSSSRCHGA
jgi:hypothetical protein